MVHKSQFCIIFFFSSEARPKAESGGRRPQAELGIRLPKKQKWSKKNSRTTSTSTTNFVPVKLFTFLSKFLTLSLPPKTFPHALHHPNLSKRHSEKCFREQKCFFPKKIIHFFFLNFFFFRFFVRFFFFKFFFRFFFFRIFFFFFFLILFFFYFCFQIFSVCLNSTTGLCILLIKQTKNTIGQNELDQ